MNYYSLSEDRDVCCVLISDSHRDGLSRCGGSVTLILGLDPGIPVCARHATCLPWPSRLPASAWVEADADGSRRYYPNGRPLGTSAADPIPKPIADLFEGRSFARFSAAIDTKTNESGRREATETVHYREVVFPPFVFVPIMSVGAGATGSVSVTDGTGTRTAKIEDGKVGAWNIDPAWKDIGMRPPPVQTTRITPDPRNPGGLRAAAYTSAFSKAFESVRPDADVAYTTADGKTRTVAPTFAEPAADLRAAKAAMLRDVGAPPPLSSLLPISSFTTVGPSGPAVLSDGTPLTFDREHHAPALKRPCTACNLAEARYFPVYSGALCHACARAKLPPLEAAPRRWPRIVAAVVGAAAAVGGAVAVWGGALP